jgi:hypothetical protein
MRGDWQRHARIALDELKAIPHGDRERHMSSIARNLSGHADASGLRRAIFAVEFLDHLKSARPEAYECLRSAPLAVVSAIARWHAFDPPRAILLALDFGRGIGTAKAITEAYNEARSGFGGKTGAAFVRAYATAAKGPICEAVEKLVGAAAGAPERSVRDPQTGTTVDYLFAISASADRPAQSVAVLVVGPYTNKKIYAHRCAEWVTKGFGLAWFYDRVLLALPDGETLDQYRNRTTVKAIPESERPDGWKPRTVAPVLDVVSIQVSTFTAEQEEALAQMGDPLF